MKIAFKYHKIFTTKKKYDERVQILKKRKLQEAEFKQRKKPKIEKEKKPCGLTKEQWSALVPVLFPRLFSIPHRLKNVHDVNVVTTDGVSASWHVHTRTKLHVRELRVGYKPIGDQGLRVLVANDIGPGYYGRVGEDCCFVPGLATCVIGIDPGHANIIVAAKRRVNNPMRSKFNLKNTTWRHMNGIHQYLQRVTSQGERHGVPIAASHLARCSSRSLSLYGVHITGRLVTAPVFTNIMRLKNNRRWKFESYQKGQRAVNKLAAAILEGVEDKNDIVHEVHFVRSMGRRELCTNF